MAARNTRVTFTAVWTVAEKCYNIARNSQKLRPNSVYLGLQLHELEIFKISKVPEYKTEACLLVSGYRLISSAPTWYVFLELDLQEELYHNSVHIFCFTVPSYTAISPVLSILTTGLSRHFINRNFSCYLNVSLPLLFNLLISNVCLVFLFHWPLLSSYALQYETKS